MDESARKGSAQRPRGPRRVARIAATITASTRILSGAEPVSSASTGTLAPSRPSTPGDVTVKVLLSTPMLQRLLLRWAFNVVALFVAAWLLSGVDYGDSWWTLLIAGVVFTLVNMIVKPILTILSIPFIVVTLGIFYFLINILMLYLTDWIVGDFEIDTFWWGALAAIIVGIVNWILNQTLGELGEREAPAY
jgi:putative membrane protein